MSDTDHQSVASGRAGTVALFGWTNVGKSTLLNRLVGEKLAAVADVAQTTRSRILAVRNVADRGQIAFVDTPGMHEPHTKLNRAMVDQIHQSVGAADVALLIVDAEHGLGRGDRKAADLLRPLPVPRVVVLNKIDRVRPKSKLLPMMRIAVEEWGFDAVFPVSALAGEGCDALLDGLLRLLPEAPPLYPADYFTDQTERSLAAEWIREKLLGLTRQELPHATAVLIDRWEEREERGVTIHASILVDRPSQKGIVIGKRANLLQQVGSAARIELQQLLGRPVVLHLWVKVQRDWRNDARILRELGL